MEVFQNPFYILTASPRDNRQRIMELADERSLLLDSEECLEARSVITHPRKRLSAEVAWFPGISPRNTIKILVWLAASGNKNIPKNEILSAIAPTARANLLAAALSNSPKQKPALLVQYILEISKAFEDIDTEGLRITINDERVVSGFPEVSDISAVEYETQERRRYYRQVIKSALDNLPSTELVKVVTTVVESATNHGEEHGPILIADLVDTYEVEAQDFLGKEEGNIIDLVDKLWAAVDAEQPDSTLASMVNQLTQVVKNWDTVAQPIQVSTKSRGLDHDASHRVARRVRDLAIHMFNQHGKLDFSQQLTNMMREVFAEVGELAELTAEDADALGKIAEQRVRVIEDAKNRADEWRKEITYEVTIGSVFKNKLRISPEGIVWKDHLWDLNAITRIRWWGTRHSVNGIPTGTTYCITFGNKSNYESIEVKNEKVYFNIVERLWKTVGARLLTEYLEGLRNGEKYRFGSTFMTDYGMELERVKLFSSNERVFCRWSELVAWNGAGVFYIAKKENKKLTAVFSYEEEDNIHIIETAIRMLLERGGERLSSLLED